MADTLHAPLTNAELRSVLDVLEDTLSSASAPGPQASAAEAAIVTAYFKLTHTRLTEAHWRPLGVHLAAWAVEALARILVPPPPAKKAAKTPAARPPRARKRRGRPRTRRAAADVADVSTPDMSELRAHDFPELGEAPTP